MFSLDENLHVSRTLKNVYCCLSRAINFRGEQAYSLRPRISVHLAFALSQSFKFLTNFIENSSNIYDIKLIYYESTFQNESSDTNLVP